MWTDPRDETAAAATADRDAPVGDSIDPEVVTALLELRDAGFFAELVDDFVTSTVTYLSDLKTALATGDTEAAYTAAHTMKSSAANRVSSSARIPTMLRSVGVSGQGVGGRYMSGGWPTLTNPAPVQSVVRQGDMTR